MSSDEDSETAEWEREQMLRGTQSRGQKYHQPRAERSSDSIDVNAAKKHVNQDIEKAEATIESLRRNIGGITVDIAKSEKRIDSLKRHIEYLESSNSFFDECASLNEPEEIVSFLDKNKSVILKLPHDQKEMFDLLERRAKESQTSMDVD